MPSLTAIAATDPVLAASITVAAPDDDGMTASEAVARERFGSSEDVAADLIGPIATASHELATRYGLLLAPGTPRFERAEHGGFTGRALVAEEPSPTTIRDQWHADIALRQWITTVVDAASAFHSRDALETAVAEVLVRATGDQPPEIGRLPHHRSLVKADLARMCVRRGLDRLRIDLDEAATRHLIDGLRGASAAAVDRIGHDLRRCFNESSATPQNIAAALHHLLTGKRFRKGPRHHLSAETVTAAAASHIADGRPVPVILQGFPFKQSDNGLKATGGLPDLGEFGTLLRLAELHRAFTHVYPPGLAITIISDGGYYRPRRHEDTGTYLAGLDDHLKLLDATDAITITPRATRIADLLSPTERIRRTDAIADLHAAVNATVAPARRRFDIDAATTASTTGDLAELTGPVLPFWRIFQSLLSSEPIDHDDGSPASLEWARLVLADAFNTDNDVPAALRRARARLLARTWADTIGYLAVLATDRHTGVDDHIFTGIRLATGAPRPGLAGFSYLGGSTLLPWHGTGCTDSRGIIATDFRIALRDRCFVPVHTPLTGHEQPFMMIPFTATSTTRNGRAISPGFAMRLRSR